MLAIQFGISDDTRRNINSIYDFKTGNVKTKCLHEGWQTSGSVKVVAKQGKKVLLIDADAQGSLTASLSYTEPDTLEVTLATIMGSLTNDEEIELAGGGFCIMRKG